MILFTKWQDKCNGKFLNFKSFSAWIGQTGPPSVVACHGGGEPWTPRQMCPTGAARCAAGRIAGRRQPNHCGDFQSAGRRGQQRGGRIG